MTILDLWALMVWEEALRYAYVLDTQGVAAVISGLIIVLLAITARTGKERSRRSQPWPTAFDQVPVSEPRG
jgi:hypothetical protein